MAKKKVFSEKEVAMDEMLMARAEYERVQEMFNWVDDDYFEIACMELTVAKLKYELCMKKLLKLCKDGKNLPQIGYMEVYPAM